MYLCIYLSIRVGIYLYVSYLFIRLGIYYLSIYLSIVCLSTQLSFNLLSSDISTTFLSYTGMPLNICIFSYARHRLKGH